MCGLAGLDGVASSPDEQERGAEEFNRPGGLGLAGDSALAGGRSEHFQNTVERVARVHHRDAGSPYLLERLLTVVGPEQLAGCRPAPMNLSSRVQPR